MLNICDLPGELLSDVAEYLEYDRLALHSLTLVSRRWRPIAERLLYRHIEPLTGRSRNRLTGGFMRQTTRLKIPNTLT
jgi:hypothetical protein